MGYIKEFVSRNKTQLENFGSLSLIQLFNIVIPFFLFPFLVQHLGQVQYGKAAFVLSLVSFLQIVVDFGFNYTGTRLIAIAEGNKERSEVFFAIMTIKFLLFLATVGLLVLLSIVVKQLQAVSELLLASTTLLAGNVFFPVWFFQGMERMKEISLINFLVKILSTVLIVAFVHEPSDLYRYIVINGVSNLVPSIIAFFYSLYLFKVFFIVPTANTLIRVLKDSANLFLSNLLIGGYSNLRIFIVGLFVSSGSLGLYSILERIYFIIQTFPLSSLSQAIYPKLVKQMQFDRERVIVVLRRLTKLSLVYFSAAVLVFISFQSLIMETFLHVELPPNSLYISFGLAATLVLVNYNSFKIEYLLMSGNSRLYRNIHVGSGVIGAILLTVLTYKWGIVGCTSSIVMTQSVVVIYTHYQLRHEMGGII